MELTSRQKLIFKTIVEQFTAHAEPIGSKTLASLLEMDLSSATIRNEMAALEKAGLLEKTHTSSGRVPSRYGYRYYVEHLMETRLDPQVEQSLKELFTQWHYSLDEAILASCSILAQMTKLTSLAAGPDTGDQIFDRLQMMPVTDRQAIAVILLKSGYSEHRLFTFNEPVSREDLDKCTAIMNESLSGIRLEDVVDEMKRIEPVMAANIVRYELLFEAFASAFMGFATRQSQVYGRANMLAQPEFNDPKKLETLLRVLESSSLFKAWIGSPQSISMPVGKRNELIQIGDCSVVSAKFHLSDEFEGQLMVVGPNRMPYSRVVALMDYMSDIIEDIFGEQTEGGSEHESKQEGSKPEN